MAKKYWTVTEVVELFQIEESFINELEGEEVIIPVCRKRPPTKVYPYEELEKLRLAKVLVEEMGVNLAGVEVVLRMKESMIQMRRQFDHILEDLAEQVQKSLRGGRGHS